MAESRHAASVVLGLDPAWFASASSYGEGASPADEATRAALVRRAYRRALLQHHPDKHMRRERGNVGTPAAAYTVDDIKAAYVALAGNAASTLPTPAQPSLDTTATGLEIVDLDELPYDEASQVWYRACRCGNERGFTLGEHDLEEELDAEAMEELLGPAAARPTATPTGELLVGCQDCSLWLCVHFAVAPSETADDENEDD
ncbi:Diphthamide biosynthesis protein 4 [Sporothrix epigloea]|uniref:Diphthamide biosynthesis protein 4 n=1 Tax=Sporothrix epigloea TaxID=1892477 RepID=A0ABP0DUK6_9PEZI